MTSHKPTMSVNKVVKYVKENSFEADYESNKEFLQNKFDYLINTLFFYIYILYYILYIYELV